MGQAFGIGWRQAYNLARVWEVFFMGHGRPILQSNAKFNSPGSHLVRRGHRDQKRLTFWLAYAEDRKAEYPGYSISDFRDEISIARS